MLPFSAAKAFCPVWAVFAEMLSRQTLNRAAQCGGQVFDAYAGCDRFEVGKFRAKKEPVYKNQAVAGQPGKHRFLDGPGFRAVGGNRSGGLKILFSHRRNVGKTPVFVVQRVIALVSETGNARLAQRRQPFGAVRGGGQIAQIFPPPAPSCCLLLASCLEQF